MCKPQSAAFSSRACPAALPNVARSWQHCSSGCATSNSTHAREQLERAGIASRPGVSNAAVRARLETAGIASRSGVANAHEDPAHASAARFPLPESERAQRECVLLPLPTSMSAAEIDRLVAAIGQRGWRT